MRGLWLLLSLAHGAACVEDHGSRPGGSGAALDGSWVEEKRVWRISFDEAAGTFQASFGGIEGGGVDGTFARETPSSITIECGGCVLEQDASIRVADHHMLFMGVMDGSEIVAAGASWKATSLSSDVDCTMRTFSSTLVLRIPEIVQQRESFCVGTADLRMDEQVLGTWVATEYGFELWERWDLMRPVFVLNGGLAFERWSRDLSP